MNMENAVKEARLRSPRLCSSTSRTAQSWLNWGELVELGLAVAAGGRQDISAQSKLHLHGGGGGVRATPTVLYPPIALLGSGAAQHLLPGMRPQASTVECWAHS